MKIKYTTKMEGQRKGQADDEMVVDWMDDFTAEMMLMNDDFAAEIMVVICCTLLLLDLLLKF